MDRKEISIEGKNVKTLTQTTFLLTFSTCDICIIKAFLRHCIFKNQARWHKSTRRSEKCAKPLDRSSWILLKLMGFLGWSMRPPLQRPVHMWVKMRQNRLRLSPSHRNNSRPVGYPGSLISSKWNLPHLPTLDISDNSFSGSVPDSLSKLVRRKRLALSGNSFKCLIHASVGSLSQLEELYLDNNDFQGPVPSTFNDLISLETWNTAK